MKVQNIQASLLGGGVKPVKGIGNCVEFKLLAKVTPELMLLLGQATGYQVTLSMAESEIVDAMFGQDEEEERPKARRAPRVVGGISSEAAN